MKKIIFVCLGNICRSPMAEFVMKDLVKKAKLEKDFYITSAGTSGEHDGEGIHYGSKKKLETLEIQTETFRSKKLTQSLCDEADFILTMDHSNFNNVLRKYKNVQNKLYKITNFAKELGYSEVPDPWYSGNFDETYTIVSKACKNLLEFLNQRH